MTNEAMAAALKQSLAQSSDAHSRSGNEPNQRGILYPELSFAIVGAAIEVHRNIGPGKLESVYQRALAHELAAQRIPFQQQVLIELHYKGESVGEFFADFIVDELVILELKAVEHVMPVHSAQVLSYLRATGLRLALLINFNAPVLWKAVKRLVR